MFRRNWHFKLRSRRIKRGRHDERSAPLFRPSAQSVHNIMHRRKLEGPALNFYRRSRCGSLEKKKKRVSTTRPWSRKSRRERGGVARCTLKVSRAERILSLRYIVYAAGKKARKFFRDVLQVQSWQRSGWNLILTNICSFYILWII